VTAEQFFHAEQAHPNSRAVAQGFALLVALTYGTVLALMSGEEFRDRENYLAYVSNASNIMHNWINEDFFRILTNEPLWILINAGLGLWLSQGQAVQILIFVPAAIVAYCMLRIDSRYLFLLFAFLLLPQILKNHVIHLRQGFGVAVFLLGWFARSPKWHWGLLLLTPLLHSSFFFVLTMLFISRVSEYWRLPLLFTWAGFLLVGVLIGFGLEHIARSLGARQGEESVIIANLDISGLGFLFWLLALMLLFFQPNSFKRENSFVIGTVLFYLSIYFLSPFAARIFESTLPLLLLAGLRMHGFARPLFLTAMLSFGALQWLVVLQGGGAFVEP
jgi:hypothetical protein